MDNIFHEKEENGVFYGEFNYVTEGEFSGSFAAKCSQVCINIILQKPRFIEGLTVMMDDQALSLTLDTLHIRTHFGITQLNDMEDLFLVNWGSDQKEVFGSLLALYHVLKSVDLNLLPLTATLHPTVTAANSNPESVRGYLYFLDHHWMVLRQLGAQWYKFDPWLGGPQLLTHFYISLYIKQLLADGNLVFVIDGVFPSCPADENESQIFSELDPVESSNEPGKLSIDMNEDEILESLRFLDLVFEGEDNELALALLLSLEDDHRKKKEMVQANALFTGSLSISDETTRPAVVSNLSSSSSGTNTSHLINPSLQPRGKLLPEISDSAHSEVGELKFFNDIEAGGSNRGLAARRNGTIVNPLLDSQLDTSFDSDDLSDPFSIIFNEPGEGVVCYDTPKYKFFNSFNPDTADTLLISKQSDPPQPPQVPARPPQPAAISPQVPARPPQPAAISPQVPAIPPQSAAIPPQPAATPRVFITSTDRSSFKKVLRLEEATPLEVENEEPTCCVCWTEPPSHVVVPCGHFCLCGSCSDNILKSAILRPLCPLCKQSANSIIKLFK